jgi:uncharacterized protein (TIGR03000 family)
MMRKMFLVLALLGVAWMACSDEASAFGRRGRGRGCDEGYYGGSGGGYAGSGYYGGGQAYYNEGYDLYGGRAFYNTLPNYNNQAFYNSTPGFYSTQGSNMAQSQNPMENQQSFYYEPGNNQQSARVIVRLPNQDGEVWFDGAATKQRGMERAFVTPTLNTEGAYTIKARWMQNGQPVERTRRVQVRAGQVQTIDFRNESSGTPDSSGNPDQLPTPKRSQEGSKEGFKEGSKEGFKEGSKEGLKEGSKEGSKEGLKEGSKEGSKERSKEEEVSTFVQEANQPQAGKMPSVKLDGEWTAVYVEMDAKKVENKNFANVSIKNNVVTCRMDGKEKTYRLDFGPHHMVRCTEQGGEKGTTDSTQKQGAHTHHGVYVASQEYLSLGLSKGIDRRSNASSTGEKEGAGQAGAAGRWQGQGAFGSDMVIILRRGGASTTGTESR